MKAEEFISKYKKEGEHHIKGFLKIPYTTDNKELLWRGDNVWNGLNAKPYVEIGSSNNKMVFSIAKDASDENIKNYGPVYEVIECFQDDNQTDEEFLQFFIDFIEEKDINLGDEFHIFIPRNPLIFD